MTSREVRQSFLDYFAQHDHRVMPSAPLKPSDATTLFTIAGMQPFVPWFRGLVPPTAPRVTTCQKCFRADDVEQVGLTPWHCTFFEMLGNFSFGDYFKREAILYAWEYVTQVLSLPKSRIWITVHPEDDEAPEIWAKEIGVPRSRIVQDETNWWGPVGDSGPCGPNTELHLDAGEERGCGRPGCNPTCDCNRFSELWNLVFQMYNKQPSGEMEPLPKPGIDTGLGMERLTVLMQGVPSIFETDLLAPIVSAVVARARRSTPELPERLSAEQDRAVKIIADHVRGLAFLLTDGFTPSNEGAGYVLRRVLRRAYRFGRGLGIEGPFLNELVPAIVATMGPVYPELRGAQGRVKTWLLQEEKQFEETLERAVGPLHDAVARAKQQPRQPVGPEGSSVWVMSGEDAFRLHDTYGLPLDITREWAAELGTAISEESYRQLMDSQRQTARARAQEDFAFAVRSGYQSFAGKTSFLGYGSCGAEGTVIGIVREGAPVDGLGEGEEGEVFLDQTPFYAESGGQVGDRGSLEAEGVRAEVLDTTHPVEGVCAHAVRVVAGRLEPGLRLGARVDESRRQAIARAHTATHLLHHMLRKVLGEHAVQSGSLVDADRLRFDFAHFSALTEEERGRIEEGVLELALRDSELRTQEMSLGEARQMGAVALFGEKYGEQVRVVQIGEFSKELCGGTHLAHAGAIGGFAIVSEGSIGAGLRRIEAVTGREAQALARRQREVLERAGEALKCRPEEVARRIETLQGEARKREREINRLQKRGAGERAADLVQEAVDVSGVKLVAARVDGLGAEALRSLADDLRNRLGSGIVVLGAAGEGGVQLVAGVSKDLVKAGFHAGNLIREVAKIAGGGGGGRPDFAQAGGKNPERLDEALAKARELVAAQRG
ncbi:MAG TPA: alanine--tRNA ligase [Armatimonadota bacterium]|nr:alanine--tRNA ligase [Armatimonadota bacterium]